MRNLRNVIRWGIRNDPAAPLAVVFTLLLSPWLMALGLGG